MTYTTLTITLRNELVHKLLRNDIKLMAITLLVIMMVEYVSCIYAAVNNNSPYLKVYSFKSIDYLVINTFKSIELSLLNLPYKLVNTSI